MSTTVPHIPRTVVGLTVENFKRVTAVDISPDPDNPIVAISGRNAQGKTSVLDALWAALESSAMSRGTRTTRPVRDGANKATVRVDLGDIIVTRTWNKAGKSTLTVTAADTGAKYTSPQTLLDDLLGRLSFDPLAFTRQSPKDQATTLLGMVDLDIDLDAIDAERADLFDTRTGVGRDRKAVGTPPTVDDTLPDEEVAAGDILARLRAAQDTENTRADTARRIDEYRDRIEQHRAAIAKLEASIAAATGALDALPAPVDLEALEAELSDLDTTNKAIRDNNAARAAAARAADLDAEYARLTDAIAAVDKRKADALAAAQFPLPGLSFDDQGVTYNGVPLGQSSAAEQLRVSCAIAAATDPSVRVMRVTDGSLLDSDSRRILADIAADQGFQVWMELVDESGEIGVVIDDGHVANVGADQ